MEVLCAAAAAFETLLHPPDLDYLDELDLEALVKASTVDGMMVRKRFGTRYRGFAWYNGHVISVVCAEGSQYYTWDTGETATVAYRVKYEDGDGEDMTQSMVLEHHLAYLEWKRVL
jgi:hypothetical protein